MVKRLREHRFRHDDDIYTLRLECWWGRWEANIAIPFRQRDEGEIDMPPSVLLEMAKYVDQEMRANDIPRDVVVLVEDGANDA